MPYYYYRINKNDVKHSSVGSSHTFFLIAFFFIILYESRHGNWTDSFRQPHRVTSLRIWTRGWKWFTRLSTNRARTSRINYTDRLISSRNSLDRVGRGTGCCTVVVTRGDRTAGRISGAFARGRFRLAGSGTHRRERTLALSPSLSLASGWSTPIALTRCITGSARYRTALIRRTHTQPMTHTNTRGTHTYTGHVRELSAVLLVRPSCHVCFADRRKDRTRRSAGPFMRESRD